MNFNYTIENGCLMFYHEDLANNFSTAIKKITDTYLYERSVPELTTISLEREINCLVHSFGFHDIEAYCIYDTVYERPISYLINSEGAYEFKIGKDIVDFSKVQIKFKWANK